MTSMTSCASGVLCIAIPIRQSRVPLSCLAGASVHFDGVSSPQPFFSWACSICSLLYIMYHLLPFNEVVKSIYVNKFYMSKLGLNMNRWNRIPSLFTVECGVRRCQIGSTAQQKWHIKIPSFSFFFIISDFHFKFRYTSGYFPSNHSVPTEHRTWLQLRLLRQLQQLWSNNYHYLTSFAT